MGTARLRAVIEQARRAAAVSRHQLQKKETGSLELGFFFIYTNKEAGSNELASLFVFNNINKNNT